MTQCRFPVRSDAHFHISIRIFIVKFPGIQLGGNPHPTRGRISKWASFTFLFTEFGIYDCKKKKISIKIKRVLNVCTKYEKN